jgi:hypothetical protein
MIQILLIILGIVLLIKGNLKVSSRKRLERPQSIYLGIIFILYGIGINYISFGNLIWSIVYNCSLVFITSIFVSKAKELATPEALTDHKETKRNALILLAFILLVVAVFYYYS